MQGVVDELRKALPPIFAGSSLDDLTGDAIRWLTIQNKRSRREIPDECFVRSGHGRGRGVILVRRDPFLDWWGTTLVDARQPAPNTPPRRRRRSGSATAAKETAP